MSGATANSAVLGMELAPSAHCQFFFFLLINLDNNAI